MTPCPLCKTPVEKLKSNSHIIPRWMMAAMKTDGRMITFFEKEIKVSQSDPKGDIVCDSCEFRFKTDDDFSAEFYRDGKYYLRSRSDIFNTTFPEKDIHDPSARPRLLNFLISVILRNHFLLKKYYNQDLLGENFEKVREHYLGLKPEPSIYAITYKLKRFELACTTPVPFYNKQRNGISVILHGYNSLIFIDGKPPLDEFKPHVDSDYLIIQTRFDNNHSAGKAYGRMVETFENKLVPDPFRNRFRNRS